MADPSVRTGADRRLTDYHAPHLGINREMLLTLPETAALEGLLRVRPGKPEMLTGVDFPAGGRACELRAAEGGRASAAASPQRCCNGLGAVRWCGRPGRGEAAGGRFPPRGRYPAVVPGAGMIVFPVEFGRRQSSAVPGDSGGGNRWAWRGIGRGGPRAAPAPGGRVAVDRLRPGGGGREGVVRRVGGARVRRRDRVGDVAGGLPPVKRLYSRCSDDCPECRPPLVKECHRSHDYRRYWRDIHDGVSMSPTDGVAAIPRHTVPATGMPTDS